MLKISWFAFKLYIKPDKITGILLFILEIIDRAKGMVSFVIVAKIIDVVVDILQKGQSVDLVLPYLIVLVGWNAFSGLISLNRWYLRNKMSQKFYWLADILIFEHYKTLGVPVLEDPEKNNAINRGKSEIFRVGDLFYQFIYFVAGVVNVVISGIAVFYFLPKVVWVLFIWIFLKNIPDLWYTKKMYQYGYNSTEDRRKYKMIIYYVLNKVKLIELSIHNATSYIKNKYLGFVEKYVLGWIKIRKEMYKVSLFLAIFDALFQFWAYFMVVSKIIIDKLSVGRLYFYISMVNRFTSYLEDIYQSLVGLYETSLRVDDIFIFFGLRPSFQDGHIKVKKFVSPPQITFDEVSFKYPNSNKFVLKNLNLNIKPGEKIAIVGVNGSGKTTLIKLLLKFYLTSKGNIMINKDNIEDIEAESYYKNVGALFQDFGTFGALNAEDNIFIGDTTSLKNKAKIKDAAVQADAHDFIKEYKNKYKQILDEFFEGGIRPSFGQWQKIAIARLFYRNPWLVIFDEPTASIDAEAEYKIFNNIYKFFENKTVIIISHRFSTVRNADRIILIDEGRILEQGNHEELIKLKGKYAKAFRLQAEGYKIEK